MTTRPQIAVSTALLVIACARSAPDPGTAPVATAPGAAIRPMTLRYHGEHRGDHTPWIYTTRVSIIADDHRGRAAWRRSYRFEQVSPPAGPDAGPREGTIALDRSTLAPLELETAFDHHHRHMVFHADHIAASSDGPDAPPTQARVPIREFIVTDMWAGFDLYVQALALAPGLDHRIAMYDIDDKPPRPFRISVERVESIRVPAGEFESFRIQVDPLDGDDRLRSIYHVRTAAPRLVVRKEYVVNPRTDGPFKRSTGIEELEAFELSPPGH